MKLIKIPNFRQAHEFSCGASALQSVLIYYLGYTISEGELIKLVKSDPRGGTAPKDIKKTAEIFGLKCELKTLSINDLKKYLDKKIPVIMPIQAWPTKKVDLSSSWSYGHYVVAVGYDKNKIFFQDPASINLAYMTSSELESRWHDVDKNKIKYLNFGIIIYGKKPKYNQNKIIKLE